MSSNVKTTTTTIKAVSNALQTGIGVVTCIMVNDAVALALAAFDIRLPASVAGLLILLLALLVTPGDHLASFLKPAADLLTHWFPLLFVPALVDFPLIVAAITGWDYPKIALVLIIGLVFTSSASGWVLIAIGYLRFRITGRTQEVVVAEQPFVFRKRKSLLSNRVLFCMAIVSILLTAVYALIPESRSIALFMIMLLVMPLTFAIAQSLAVHYPDRYFPNPILASSALSILTVYLLSVHSGEPFLALLKQVHSKARMNIFTGYSLSIGAGDIYLYLLNAGVVAMSLRMYHQKHALYLYGVPMLFTAVIVAISSIFFTIGLCRILFVSDHITRSVALRTITTPIAMASIPFIQGLPGIAGAVSVITGVIGAIFWKEVVNLRVNKFVGPLVRGFAVGSSSHGMGTAILAVEEPESMPFSTVAFIEVGIASSILISIPSFRDLIESML